MVRSPAAVLRSGSVRDIQAMARFCRRCGVRVAARDEHHTMFGQSLSDGVVIERPRPDRLHPPVRPAAREARATVHAPARAEGGECVYLFDVLTASALPVTSHSYVRRMLDRNRRWWEP
ncbi:MAG TPA: hypothetical protein VGC59_04025, partial [Solirubrobacteraceae bacterium]